MTGKFTNGTTLEAYVYRMVEAEGRESAEFKSLEKSLGIEKMRELYRKGKLEVSQMALPFDGRMAAAGDDEKED